MRGAGSKLEEDVKERLSFPGFFRRGLPASGLSDRLLYAPDSEPDVRCQARLRWCLTKADHGCRAHGRPTRHDFKASLFRRATTVRRRSSPHSDNLKEISTRPAITLKVSAARSG